MTKLIPILFILITGYYLVSSSVAELETVLDSRNTQLEQIR